MKKRLDLYLYQRGLFESRSMAARAIMEGLVSVEGVDRVKPGTQVRGEENITVRENPAGYVSRGGVKLAHALDTFGVPVDRISALDVGASTGGFTDCLLRRGVARVTALDVGKGQLHWALRNDPRVTVIEGLNARYLTPEDLPYRPDLVTVDVSFISLTKVLGRVFGVTCDRGKALVLVKPQFEAGRKQVEKGGIVRKPEVHLEVLEGLREWMTEEGVPVSGICASPIEGAKGNREFFFYIDRDGPFGIGPEDIEAVVLGEHQDR